MQKFQQLPKVNLLAEELQHHDFMSIVGVIWTWKKSESKMGFEPTTLRDLVRCFSLAF